MPDIAIIDAKQSPPVHDTLVKDFDHSKSNMQGHSASAPPSWTRKTSRCLSFCLPPAANIKTIQLLISERDFVWRAQLEKSLRLPELPRLRCCRDDQGCAGEAHLRGSTPALDSSDSSRTLEVWYMHKA